MNPETTPPTTQLAAEDRAVSLLHRLAWASELGEAVPALCHLALLRPHLPVAEGQLRALALEALDGRAVGGMTPDRLVEAIFSWLSAGPAEAAGPRGRRPGDTEPT